MWAKLKPQFKGFPAQERIAQLMVTYGLRAKDGAVFVGEIELADSAIARAARVADHGEAGAGTVAPADSSARRGPRRCPALARVKVPRGGSVEDPRSGGPGRRTPSPRCLPVWRS